MIYLRLPRRLAGISVLESYSVAVPLGWPPGALRWLKKELDPPLRPFSLQNTSTLGVGNMLLGIIPVGVKYEFSLLTGLGPEASGAAAVACAPREPKALAKSGMSL